MPGPWPGPPELGGPRDGLAPASLTALLSGSALPLLVAVSGGCSPPAPALAGLELHALVFADSIPKFDIEDFAKTTGARLTIDTYDTNEELLARLKATPAAFDLVMPSDYAVDELIDADGLRPLELAHIPNYNNIAPNFLSPWFDPGGIAQAARGRGKNAKYSLPWLWGTTGILYDPTAVKPAPTRWADLWNPALTAQLVLPDDPREALGIALLADGHSKNATDPAQIDAAKAKLLPIARGALALDANAPEAWFAPGRSPALTATIGAVYNGNAVLARRANPALVYVLPEDGAGIWFDNLAIPAQAPHPDGAETLINYLLSADCGAGVIEELPFSTPNQAAAPALREHDEGRWKAYVEDPVANPQMDALSGAVPVKNVGPAAQARYEAAWAEIVAARPPRTIEPTVQVTPIEDGAAPAPADAAAPAGPPTGPAAPPPTPAAPPQAPNPAPAGSPR